MAQISLYKGGGGFHQTWGPIIGASIVIVILALLFVYVG